jgi:hypothetical protein
MPISKETSGSAATRRVRGKRARVGVRHRGSGDAHLPRERRALPAGPPPVWPHRAPALPSPRSAVAARHTCARLCAQLAGRRAQSSAATTTYGLVHKDVLLQGLHHGDPVLPQEPNDPKDVEAPRIQALLLQKGPNNVDGAERPCAKTASPSPVANRTARPCTADRCARRRRSSGSPPAAPCRSVASHAGP